MAGGERHLRQFADVPGGDYHAARIGLVAQGLQHLRDLVMPAPVAPLLAVDGAEVAVLVRPFVPNGNAVLLQPADIGVAAQKPQQFIGDGFEMHPLGGQQRKTTGEVKAHLVAEDGAGAGAGAVAFRRAVREDVAQQLKICLHAAPVAASARDRGESSAG